MGQCISSKNSKMRILPGIEEKYQKQLRRTKSLLEKNQKSSQLKKRNSEANMQTFLDVKEFVGLNNNPLISEYR